jgi:hypothetical protein
MGKEPRNADKEAAENRDKSHHMNGDSPGVKMNDRGCTDIIVCLLFIFMMVVMVFITGFSFTEGDIQRIATKYDMDGVKCTEKYPNKLFTRIMPARKYEGTFGPAVETGAQEQYLYYSVCVEDCPKNGTKDLKFLPNKEYPATSDKLSPWDHDT